jgi:hypothetical protein
MIFKSLTGRLEAHGDKPVSILTYPTVDIAGDYVRPDGGEWSSKFPVAAGMGLVNWAHGIPVGRGAVTLKSIVHEGQAVNVAVGTTHFFEKQSDLEGIDRTEYRTPTDRVKVGEYSVADCLKSAEDARELVNRGIATGVSIEFTPAGPKGEAWWDLDAWNPLDKRRSRHFENWTGLAYAHARIPVNPA